MNYVGLFEGISGFGLAFKRAGASIRTICEINADCQKVLRRHHPEAEIISDVKEIRKDTFENGAIDILAGGFPCQDLSVAGLRKGLDGERSGLWFEFIRIIADHRPRWVVIENVPGLLSSNGGRDFAVVLRGLVECGYGVCWRVFDSQYDGVAQRRQRVFIVASIGNQRCAEILFEREGSAWDSPPRREAWERVADSLTVGANQTCGFPGDITESRLPVGCRMMAFGEYVDDGTSSTLKQRDYKDATDLIVTPTLRANGDAHSGFTTGDGLVITPQIAHTLTSGGADASEDGTGRGTPIVATWDERNITSKANRTRVEFGQPANTLHQGGLSVIAFTERTRAEGRTLEAQEELAYALTNPGSGGRTHSRQIAGQFGVRRLTPTECEALQGFPRDWTAYGDDGKPISDSARYRMLGNAVCVPTAEWIARRILQQEVAA